MTEQEKKVQRNRTYIDCNPELMAIAQSACKLIQPKEFFYEFTSMAIVERLERLIDEGRLPKEFKKLLEEASK